MKRLLQLGILCCALWLAGCGGGGDSGGGTPVVPTSRVQLSVNWPERSRAISGPSSALSFAVTLQGLEANGGRITVQNRGANDAAHTETYNVDVTAARQQYPFRIDFFAGESAGGEVVATAGGNVTLAAQPVQVPDVALTGTIASVSVPEGHTALVGETSVITAQAKDAEGHTVAVSPGSFTWSITSGGDKLAKVEDGFRGSAIGTAEVTATVDGKTSSAVPVRVGQRVRWSRRLEGTPYPLRYLAFQDGSQPWVQVPLVEGTNQYQATVFSEDGRYGWAWIDRLMVGTTPQDGVDSTFKTVAESTESIGGGTSQGPNERRELKVRVLGREAGEEAFVCNTPSNAQSMGSKTTMTLLVTTGKPTTVAAFSTLNGVTTRMVIRRNIAANVNQIDLDLRGATSFGDFTATEVDADPDVTVRWQLNNGEAFCNIPIVRREDGGSSLFYLPPASQMTAEDDLTYFASVTEEDGRFRTVNGRRANMDLPAEISLPGFYDGLELSRAKVGYSVGGHFPHVDGAVNYGLDGSADATPGWAGASALDLATPNPVDLPGVPEVNIVPSTTVYAAYRWANISYLDYVNNRDHMTYESKTAGVRKIVRSD